MGAVADQQEAQVRHLRLTHPDLDFYVDARLWQHDGRWLAVADLADEPDIGTGTDPRKALRGALSALGEPYASDMARDAELEANE